MSWPRLLSCTNIQSGLPRRALLVGVLALAACGLQPVYGPGGAATKLFGQVRPSDPATPDEFIFDRRIAERLGPDGGAYTLLSLIHI